MTRGSPYAPLVESIILASQATKRPTDKFVISRFNRRKHVGHIHPSNDFCSQKKITNPGFTTYHSACTSNLQCRQMAYMADLISTSS